MKTTGRLESEVQQLCKIEAAKHDCILQRNNVGAFKDATGRMVRYGLGNDSKTRTDQIKSSDEIGFTIVTVTPEMVGQKIAVYTAFEFKREGWTFSEKDKREIAQKRYIDWVLKSGGIAGFVSCLDDLLRILKK